MNKKERLWCQTMFQMFDAIQNGPCCQLSKSSHFVFSVCIPVYGWLDLSPHCVCWGASHLSVYVPVREYLEAINWHHLFPWVKVSPWAWHMSSGDPLANSQCRVTGTDHHTMLSLHMGSGLPNPGSLACAVRTLLNHPSLDFINVWNANLTFLGLMRMKKIILIRGVCLMHSCLSESVLHLKGSVNCMCEMGPR